MVRSTDITSFTEYRNRLREHHDHIRETGRPLFVTNKGETEAVVLTPQVFDELLDLVDLSGVLKAIDQGETDLTKGRSQNALDAIKAMASDNGLDIKP
ncbi:type II toxin-antitoxin system Phd/YefM family antitoxin [Mucisphaera sp.]|uniref:type II toxin-antitoxin system Phd/YefM family antitoxin n=1 Tax=Mucisphaera sp. TaxID=2913024 RepID=UPI003D0E01CB